MAISSLNLEAFAAVAQSGSFLKAAKMLHITQSALSQRVMNLEAELSTTLVVRDPRSLRLTPAGEKLLRYSQMKDQLESDALELIAGSNKAIAGAVRLGAFSSILRSAVLP